MEKARILEPRGERSGDGVAAPIRDRSGHEHVCAGDGADAGAARGPLVAVLDVRTNGFRDDSHSDLVASVPYGDRRYAAAKRFIEHVVDSRPFHSEVEPTHVAIDAVDV